MYVQCTHVLYLSYWNGVLYRAVITNLTRKMKVRDLKVLTNEKRGGLILVSFDWSRFRPFMLKFSKESVQTPSCERPKTAQRTLFLSFEINNCFPITV
jgi:hypothetical protein